MIADTLSCQALMSTPEPERTRTITFLFAAQAIRTKASSSSSIANGRSIFSLSYVPVATTTTSAFCSWIKFGFSTTLTSARSALNKACSGVTRLKPLTHDAPPPCGTVFAQRPTRSTCCPSFNGSIPSFFNKIEPSAAV